MRSFGPGALLDDLSLRMNRAAEQAAPRALDIFVTAVTRKTFDEAVAEGLLRLSGARAGAISAWFPLVSLRQVGDL